MEHYEPGNGEKKVVRGRQLQNAIKDCLKLRGWIPNGNGFWKDPCDGGFSHWTRAFDSLTDPEAERLKHLIVDYLKSRRWTPSRAGFWKDPTERGGVYHWNFALDKETDREAVEVLTAKAGGAS